MRDGPNSQKRAPDAPPAITSGEASAAGGVATSRQPLSEAPKPAPAIALCEASGAGNATPTTQANEGAGSRTSDRRSKPIADALLDFIGMSEGQPHRLILRSFVEQIIRRSDVCDEGSILLYNPATEKLKLYDERMASDSIAEMQNVEFSIYEGVAGLAFRKRAPEYAPDVSLHPEFKPGQGTGPDIHSLYCLPIRLDRRDQPFGVVSCHNPESLGEINPDQRLSIQIAVKMLEALLSLTPLAKRVVPRKKVFIVHGRNEKALDGLKKLLEAQNIEYIVIASFARTGQDLLTFIEEQIRDCIAGFVLLTPDDEGRCYKFGEPMRQRARQNVIFESGYLTSLFRGVNRVCFLQQGDLEIPSDLNGLLMERFEENIDGRRFNQTLKAWGLDKKDREVQWLEDEDEKLGKGKRASSAGKSGRGAGRRGAGAASTPTPADR